MNSRQGNDDVTSSDEEYDLVVIGGGITGAGAARDAALRGLRVLLVEKSDFGSGTSSKSSKLIHGGLRYLQTGQVKLVFESVSERWVQTQVAPHLVKSQQFVIPVYQQNKPGMFVLNLGLWVYGLLALFRGLKTHKVFRGKKRAKQLEPSLEGKDLKGALLYYDCGTDDARLVLENVIDAEALGARCLSYTMATNIRYHRQGDWRQITLTDTLTGTTSHVRAKAIVVAAGAWTDEIATKLDIGIAKGLLRPTKGVHLVFRKSDLALERTITIISPVDGRVMFAIPWKDRTVIGTTDTDYQEAADNCFATRADAEYLCRSANAYFTGAELTPQKAISSWAGLRPLIQEQNVTNEGEISREHEILSKREGVFVIAGGKLTTYRIMAKQVVDRCMQYLLQRHVSGLKLQDTCCRTKNRRLPGAQNAEVLRQCEDRLRQHVSNRLLTQQSANHLLQTYGSRLPALIDTLDNRQEAREQMEEGLPYIWAEVWFVCKAEFVRTVEDVLARRIPLMLVGSNQGLDVTDRVSQILAKQLGWTEEFRQQSVGDYQVNAKKNVAFH